MASKHAGGHKTTADPFTVLLPAASAPTTGRGTRHPPERPKGAGTATLPAQIAPKMPHLVGFLAAAKAPTYRHKGVGNADVGMRKRAISIASILGLLGLAACSDDFTGGGLVPCTSRLQCQPSQACLNNFCVSLPDGTEPPDGGEMDGGPDPQMDGSTDGSMMPDTGPFDAGQPDAGQPRCMTPDCNLCANLHPNAVVCENFDDLVAAPWRPVGGAGGNLAPTDSEFLAGGGALRVSAAGGGAGNRYIRDIDPPITEGNIYLRTYVLIPGTMPPSDFVVLANLDDGSADKLSLDLTSGGAVQMIRTGGLRLQAEAGAIPTNQWRCLEFHYRISDAGISGIGSLFVEGELAQQLPVAEATAPSGGFSRLSVGIVSSGSGNPSQVEILMDELVVSTVGRIGCIP